MRVENLAGDIAEFEIDRPDDTCRDLGFTVEAGRRHGRDAIHKFGFADGSEGHRAVLPKHRPTFDEHGRNDVMPAIHVGADLVDEITWLHPAIDLVPQVMVRIAYRQIRLQRLFMDKIEPRLIV